MKKWMYLLGIIVFVFMIETEVYAKEITISRSTVMEEPGEYFDFDEIQEFLDDKNNSEGLDFEDVVKEFMQGDTKGGADKFVETIKENLFQELSVNRSSIKKIIAIALVAAIFSNFARIFKNSQVSETGFSICYVAIMTYLLGSFTALSYIAYEVIGDMFGFMKALLPIYAVSVGIGAGQVYAVSFYETTLVIIGIINLIALKLLLPAIDIYVAISMVNHLSREDYLSKTCELIKNMVSFAIKTMFTVVLGLNVIQNMFTPISGTIGGNAAKNIIGVISGIPGAGNGVTELLYGTGQVLRNSIGGAGVIVLSVLLLVPIIKIVIFIFTYQLTNAIIQPISDKRITGCVGCISDAAVLILRSVFTVSVLFVITIALVCLSGKG